MITFKNVSKQYDHQLALSNVSFTVHPGEMIFLTGPSGAGKSTLLKLIMAIENVTRGQIEVNEHIVGQLNPRKIAALRQHIGMIFQDPQLMLNRTIYDNIALPLYIAGYKKNDIQKRVHAALDKVNLLNKENYYPKMLSTGEQQRVGIARAIVNKPPILLADEPTGNLDPDLSLEIFKLFEAFNAVGVTTVIATHDVSLIRQFHHRQIFLKNGVMQNVDT